ncbi:zinc-binding dehydrogenase [Micromonospora sp. NBC_01699]|nr:zinc-binding dehydrogenase [Micromonospora sp. NBC_01699]
MPDRIGHAVDGFGQGGEFVGGCGDRDPLGHVLRRQQGRTCSPSPARSRRTDCSVRRSPRSSPAAKSPCHRHHRPGGPSPARLRRGLRHLRSVRHRAVADGGRYASIATQAGPVPDLSARGVRTTIHQVREDGPALAALAELVELVDRGLLTPRVDAIFGLPAIHAAHTRFQRGGLAGKVAVVF